MTVNPVRSESATYMFLKNLFLIFHRLILDYFIFVFLCILFCFYSQIWILNNFSLLAGVIGKNI